MCKAIVIVLCFKVLGINLHVTQVVVHVRGTGHDAEIDKRCNEANEPPSLSLQTPPTESTARKINPMTNVHVSGSTVPKLTRRRC